MNSASKNKDFSSHLWDSSELYRDAVTELEFAAKTMKLDPNLTERLRVPKRAMVVSVPIRMDDGSVRSFEGFRVQHNITLGPAKGGIRFHHEVNLSEVAGLAMLMSMKTSLVGLPLGGGKGGIRVDASQLSRAEHQSLMRRYTMEIINIIGPDKDIPAPDVGTNAQSMAWLMDTYSQATGYPVPGVVTGKPIDVGGSLGRAESTGRGVVYTTEHAMKYLDKIGKSKLKMDSSSTVAVQGFGNVGSVAAHEYWLRGMKVVAVSDVSGGVYNKNGLNIPEVMEYVNKNRTLAGYKNAEPISNGDLLELSVDVLTPAAMESAITTKNVKNIKAKIVAEGANGPVSPEAMKELEDRGVFIVPDVLCNAGGVIVSYFEWVQGLQQFFWSEEEVNEKLAAVLETAFKKVVAIKEQYRCGMKTAALISSVDRISKAMSLRGLFP